jgi:hypothetical protein
MKKGPHIGQRKDITLKAVRTETVTLQLKVSATW